MSIFAGSHHAINSRTAGYIPGASAARSAPSTTPSHSPSSPSGRSGFETLLRKSDPSSSPSFSPSEKMGAAATADQPHDTKQQIQAETASHRSYEPGRSRTAGRTLSIRDGSAGPNDVKQDFTFGDIVDVINPLQHLPVVSTAYRAFTGDEINSTARIMGGALYGGPAGAAFGIANAVMNDTTGKDIGGTVMAFMTGNHGKPEIMDGPQQLAASKEAVKTAHTDFSKITKDQIIWSQPRTNSSLTHPPRLENETVTTGSGAAAPSSSSPDAGGAPRQTFNIAQNLSSATPTHNAYPMHGEMTEGRSLALHSLHTLPVDRTNGTATPMSDASPEEERNRKEIPSAGQESVGSPLFLSLQEAPAQTEESGSSSESIALQSVPDQMSDALNKYKAMQQQRHH